MSRDAIRSHLGPPPDVQVRALEAEIWRLSGLGWSRNGIARRFGLHPDRVGEIIDRKPRGRRG